LLRGFHLVDIQGQEAPEFKIRGLRALLICRCPIRQECLKLRVGQMATLTLIGADDLSVKRVVVAYPKGRKVMINMVEDRCNHRVVTHDECKEEGYRCKSESSAVNEDAAQNRES
jgi:hypothetical protein